MMLKDLMPQIPLSLEQQLVGAIVIMMTIGIVAVFINLTRTFIDEKRIFIKALFFILLVLMLGALLMYGTLSYVIIVGLIQTYL